MSSSEDGALNPAVTGR